MYQFSRSVVTDSATPWTAACQASLSFTISQSLLKLMSMSQWCHQTISFLSQCFVRSASRLFNSLTLVVQSLSYVWLLLTPWTAAGQASLSITNSRNLFKLMSIELVMPSNHLNLCHPLLLLPSIFSSIRIFSNESTLCIRWPKYWSFSFSISPSNEHSGQI